MYGPGLKLEGFISKKVTGLPNQILLDINVLSVASGGSRLHNNTTYISAQE